MAALLHIQNMRLSIILFFICFCFTVGYTQSVTIDAARAELQKRGYDETRFREEMAKKGFPNPESIDPNNTVEMARAQKAVEEVMQILDKERSSNSSSTPPPTINTTPNPAGTQAPPVLDPTKEQNVLNQSKDIQKAVKEGATLEEAVVEKIQDQTKENLPLAITYGQHIFRDKSLSLFRASGDAKPSKSYILGTGDKVSVSIWGQSQENFTLEINKDGFIQPTGLPRFYLSGLSVDAAEKLMEARLRSKYYFTKENFEMVVTTARTVNVNIVGEVFSNGAFNISALNTAFNALVAAGGPTDIGSVRKIQIKSVGNKSSKILDVYKYLQDPITAQEFYLQENDYIFVPVADKLVTISGAVNRPFRYELLDNENLNEIIKFSGGLKANALKGNIKVTRIESDSIRIIDVNLNDLTKSNGNFKLLNGDQIEIATINTTIKNEVNISGAVENPGKYALNNNPTVYDLITKAILLDNALTSGAYIKRLNADLKTIRYEYINLQSILENPKSADNILLQKGDELIISSQASFVDKFDVNIEGAVREPKKMSLDRSKNLKVTDAIFFSGGLRPNATDFAYIFRADMTGLKTVQYIKVDVQKALSSPSSSDNVTLEPNDRLVFYSRDSYSDESLISVSGAVRQAGEFVYNPSLTLKDALLLAGGLRPEAALERIDVFRLTFEEGKSTRVLVANLKLNNELEIQNNGGVFDLRPFDQIIVRNAPEFEKQRTISINGEVKYPGAYALLNDNTRLASVITQAGGVTDEAFLKGATLQRSIQGEEGYIIINLEKALKSTKGPQNVILQQGDIILIPKIKNIVTVSGAVQAQELYVKNIATENKVQIPYTPGKSIFYYIDDYAGGFAENADKSKVTVIDATGKIRKTKSFLGFKSYPKVTAGSQIVIGYKKAKTQEGKNKEEVKWGDILANSIAQATAILSLILLVQNVN
jgi:protein involved in polysaccharide export with SLBB domain